MSDYAKIADALRFTASEITNCNMVALSMRTLVDGAVAIEELMAQVRDKDYLIQQQAEEIERLWRDVKRQQEKMIKPAKKLPKRGEWVGVSPTVDTVQCSICGGQLFSSELETPYCPYCGAKMNDSNASNALNALDNAHDGLNNAHDGLIVRCRECRYRITSHGISDGWVLCSKPYTERGNAMHRDDWFCADGERKVQG